LDLCDSLDFSKAVIASNAFGSYKLFAAIRVAATGWSGMHTLLFCIWTFSDHSATKQLLLDIDVAFGHPTGTFMKKIEAISRYWYKLLHMPAQQTREDECSRQMKDAFLEFENLLLAYNEQYASVVGDTGVAAQAGGDDAKFHRLFAQHGLWALVPELCNAADNTDHHQMMADTRNSKINSYLEVFHAIQMVCGSQSYMLFTQCSLIMSCRESEAVNEAGKNLCAKCELPAGISDQFCDDVVNAFRDSILSMQPLLPGAQSTNERLSAMRSFVRLDEVYAAVQKHLTRRQSHIQMLYRRLAASAGEAEPEPLKEQVEKEDRVSAPRAPQRRSLGGA